MYEKYLSGKKLNYVVTIEEAGIYLSHCNRKWFIYNLKKKEK